MIPEEKLMKKWKGKWKAATNQFMRWELSNMSYWFSFKKWLHIKQLFINICDDQIASKESGFFESETWLFLFDTQRLFYMQSPVNFNCLLFTSPAINVSTFCIKSALRAIPGNERISIQLSIDRCLIKCCAHTLATLSIFKLHAAK